MLPGMSNIIDLTQRPSKFLHAAFLNGYGE